MMFNQVVDAIIAHRKANPRFNLPTDRASVDNELEQYTVARLLKIRGGDAWLTADNPGEPDPKARRLPLPRRGASVVEGVKRKGVGIKIIMDWLGSGGKPVDQLKAETRAINCSLCPMNVEMNLADVLTAAAAEAVHQTVEAKNQMALRTKYDDSLKVCGACDCKLDLKIWTPISHIIKETTKEALDRLDPKCWVLAESK